MRMGRPQNFESRGLSKRTCLTHGVSFGISIGGIFRSRTIRIGALEAGSTWIFLGSL